MSERIEKQQTFEARKRGKTRQSKDLRNPDALAIQRKKNEAAIRLLNEWLADESGRQEREWPIIKAALEADHPSYGRLFND